MAHSALLAILPAPECRSDAKFYCFFIRRVGISQNVFTAFIFLKIGANCIHIPMFAHIFMKNNCAWLKFIKLNFNGWIRIHIHTLYTESLH